MTVKQNYKVYLSNSSDHELTIQLSSTDEKHEKDTYIIIKDDPDIIKNRLTYPKSG
jgi:hypothetical protein